MSQSTRALSPDPGDTGGTPQKQALAAAKPSPQAAPGDRPTPRPEASQPEMDEDDGACGRGTQPE